MKLLNRILKQIVSIVTSPFTLGLLVTVAITMLALHYYSVSGEFAELEQRPLVKFIRQMHDKSIDFRFNDRGERSGSERVAILAIDEKSIEQEGRWPWPRDKMAKLIERTLSYGASDIAFDIIWSEEDGNNSIPTLNRLRRDLSEAKKLSPELDSVFEHEIENGDSDRIFATTAAGLSDHLVMGAYFENYEGGSLHEFSPAQEFCVDALFGRRPESGYWRKETSALEVVDEDLAKLRFPTELKDHLPDYFTMLEIQASTQWFERNPSKVPALERALKDLGDPFPPEAFPGLSAVWLNGEAENVQALLEQTKPELATKDGVAKVFARFDSAFTRKEKATLQQAIRNSGELYCHRFLTPDDDLTSFEAFAKIWGTDDDQKESFKGLSVRTLWEQVIQKKHPEYANESFDQAVSRLNRETSPNMIENVARWWVNIPLLAEVTKHSGYFNAFLDLDGAVRRSSLLVRRGHSYMPSLAMKAFLVSHGYRLKATLKREKAPGQNEWRKAITRLEALDKDGKTALVIPADGRASISINYSGKRRMFPYISAADLLSEGPTAAITVREYDERTGRFIDREKEVDKREFLKDKILIAGATATGVYDLRVTPFEENYPGVETHANVLSNLIVESERAQIALAGATRATASAADTTGVVSAKGPYRIDDRPGFLRSHPKEASYMWPALLILGLVLSALLSYFGSVVGLAITAAAITGVYAVDKYVFFRNGIVITSFFPMLMVAGNFVTLTFYKYFTEERKKRALKGTFEKYVSPAIVAEVLADPENIELGGKKMELTVMFSDVRGFTTISEKLDPRALSDLLNSYLTPMTNLVFAHKGTLDKYMGDAVMAFWGAPIHFPDHAKHACRCALEMLVKLKELQASYRAKGLPEIDIGIGLNSGEMSVGNMGSDTVRSYTVMGDAVNLGSRLEGINKQYGTRIIISEFTQSAIKDTFVTREVDWVRVKGKAQPVRIFELVAEGGVEESKARLLKLFDEGFHLYHAREFEKAILIFKQALEIDPDDAPTQLYLERCQDYQNEPPPADWDGVFTMKTK
jgi:adenylate cyclase